MEYLSKDELLEDLPLLLAGPILRRIEARSVTVWVALKQSCQVNLQIFETQQAGERLGQCVFRGERETIALGQYLHVVAVTAYSLNPEQGINAALESDRLYAYDLHFVAQDCTYSLSTALSRPSHASHPASKAAADTQSISYFAHQKPTFALPPKALSHLKIVHGSCRKPHGEGFDALPILDCLIAAAAHNPQARPHQLLMTGDQIYGDDVADPLLWIATPLGDALLGWEEKLPLDHSDADAPADALNGGARPRQLPAGQRARFATEQAGITAGLTGKEERTTSHLFSFGEYCAAYLLAHSPACWPARLPNGKEVTQERKTIRRWESDKRNMEQFLYSLWKVRRLLANIATYTIFDDHDVSDDWNLNQAWCLRILGKPLGYQTVQNALLAYAVFQAWGNTPQQFEQGTSGSALLLVAQQWSVSQGQNLAAKGAIAAYLGLPPINAHTGLPEFVEDSSVWVLQRSEKALTWHYTIRSACHEVIVLDTRTYRGYPIEGKPIDPPMLLSPSAFQQQLSNLLNQSPLPSISSTSNRNFNNDSGSDSGSNSGNDCEGASAYATFIVAPTNVFGMRVLDWIQQWHLDRRKVFSADVGDSWNFHDQALAMLLTTLFQHRQNVVVLSGDIHYSSAINVDYEDLTSGHSATLVQLTSSAMKNEELLTRILHTRLKDWLLPEKPRQWVGQFSPANMTELPAAKAKTQRTDQLIQQAKQHNISADWRCQMRWLQRQRTEPLALMDSALNELIPLHVRSQNSFLEWLKFWKARWFQEGQEVVGINNIALVYFQLEDRQDDKLENRQLANSQSIHSQNLVVKQAHYWFSPWFPVQVVRSRFK